MADAKGEGAKKALEFAAEYGDDVINLIGSIGGGGKSKKNKAPQKVATTLGDAQRMIVEGFEKAGNYYLTQEGMTFEAQMLLSRGGTEYERDLIVRDYRNLNFNHPAIYPHGSARPKYIFADPGTPVIEGLKTGQTTQQQITGQGSNNPSSGNSESESMAKYYIMAGIALVVIIGLVFLLKK